MGPLGKLHLKKSGEMILIEIMLKEPVMSLISKAEFLTTGKACKATIWLTPSLKEMTFDSFYGLSVRGTISSESVASHAESET